MQQVKGASMSKTESSRPMWLSHECELHDVLLNQVSAARQLPWQNSQEDRRRQYHQAAAPLTLHAGS